MTLAAFSRPALCGLVSVSEAESKWSRIVPELGDASDQGSLVEWMREVERANGNKATNRVLTFAFTAGVGSVLQAQREASWPDDCDASPNGFCPRGSWNKEVVYLYRMPQEFTFAALRHWCEAPGRGGRIIGVRVNLPNLRNAVNMFCEVGHSPVGAVLQDGLEHWYVIEPKQASAMSPLQIEAAFSVQGLKTYSTREASREQARLRGERQREQRFREVELETMERGRKEREDVPVMRQIGTRICRVSIDSALQSEIRFVGFTEGVSPDNGKIQIRVSSASIVGAQNLSPGGFQPHIIWDDPMNWSLCDR